MNALDLMKAYLHGFLKEEELAVVKDGDAVSVSAEDSTCHTQLTFKYDVFLNDIKIYIGSLLHNKSVINVMPLITGLELPVLRYPTDSEIRTFQQFLSVVLQSKTLKSASDYEKSKFREESMECVHNLLQRIPCLLQRWDSALKGYSIEVSSLNTTFSTNLIDVAYIKFRFFVKQNEVPCAEFEFSIFLSESQIALDLIEEENGVTASLSCAVPVKSYQWHHVLRTMALYIWSQINLIELRAEFTKQNIKTMPQNKFKFSIKEFKSTEVKCCLGFLIPQYGERVNEALSEVYFKQGATESDQCLSTSAFCVLEQGNKPNIYTTGSHIKQVDKFRSQFLEY